MTRKCNYFSLNGQIIQWFSNKKYPPPLKNYTLIISLLQFAVSKSPLSHVRSSLYNDKCFPVAHYGHLSKNIDSYVGLHLFYTRYQHITYTCYLLYRDSKSKIRYNPVNKPHSLKVNPSVFATGLCHRELYREKVVRRLLTQHNRHLRREQQQKNKLIIE